MAMLISKFHRLIQSKLVWIAILIIIVFSFVVWGTQMPSKADRDQASSPGTLNGEAVDAKQFRQMYFNTYLSVIMSVGRQINITPQIDQQLRKAAWQRLGALNQARELGLSASDDEVAMAIQQYEAFQSEGQFNPSIYKAFAQQFLAAMGFTERMFEEHVREEIVMQKTRLVLDRSTLVTPTEVARAFSSVSDRFKVDYVIIKPELVTNSVKVGRDEARALFDKDPAAFTLPEKVKVQVVRFNDAPFIPQVKVTEDETRAYYDENLSEFEVEDTNSLAEAATNLLATVGKVTRPFEEVKQDIANQLIQRAAREKASDLAMNFVVALTPDREGKASSFADVASNQNVTVTELGPFSAEEELTEVDAGPAFNRAAFELSEGEETYFSNPVEGKEGVYVLALIERQVERVPTFEEVEKQVMPVARNQALAEALSRKAAEIRDTLDKAMQNGQSFSEALIAFGLEAEKTLEFTASTDLEEVPYADVVTRGVMLNNRGELSDLLPAKDAILIAHVADRIAGDPASFGSIRGQLVNTIRRQYGRMSFDAWQEDLLKQANFQERQTASVNEEPIEGEVPAEPAN
jgi:parvulin-like peptidyl-prolyl isomerase